MADYFSNHYVNTADATRQTNPATTATGAAVDVAHRVAPGLGHGRRRTKIAHFQGILLQGTSDTVRLMTFKSSDRLFNLFWTSDDAGLTGDVNIGIALSGLRHNGDVVDDNLFSTVALDVNAAAIDRVDQFVNGALGAEHRGLQMWELLAIGGGTDTEDPQTQYDLIITCTEDFETATDIVVEAHYTAGD